MRAWIIQNVFLFRTNCLGIENSRCFFMVLLFELIKKNFTSFELFLFFSIFPPEKVQRIYPGENVINSVHKHQKDKILRPEPFWTCGNSQKQLCGLPLDVAHPSSVLQKAPVSGGQGQEEGQVEGVGYNSLGHLHMLINSILVRCVRSILSLRQSDVRAYLCSAQGNVDYILQSCQDLSICTSQNVQL